MRSSKQTPYGTNLPSESSDKHKIKFFVSGLDRVFERAGFYGENFSNSIFAENFTIDVARAVEPILKVPDFFLIWLKRYSLITF